LDGEIKAGARPEIVRRHSAAISLLHRMGGSLCFIAWAASATPQLILSAEP